MQQVYEATGVKPAALENAPECPETLEYIWQFFKELETGRSSGGMSVNPISYPDIDAWSRLKNIVLTPFEVDVIKMIDSVFFNHHFKKTKGK